MAVSKLIRVKLILTMTKQSTELPDDGFFAQLNTRVDMFFIEDVGLHGRNMLLLDR